MKKRLIALLIALSALLTACAAPAAPVTAPSGAMTAAPKETEAPDRFAPGHLTGLPDYTLPEGADPQLVRETAVRAMRDMLSVRWTPRVSLSYNKEGAVGEKDFHFYAGRLYAGLPYTEAGGSLVQFLQYYDFETGTLTVEKNRVNDLVGNVCGGAVMWGWAAVSHTLHGLFQSGSMTYAQGVIPVGSWTYPADITTFHQYPTCKIVADNGEDVMMESYALLRMADGLTSSGEGSLGAHTVMAAEDAVVVRKNGKVDPEESYVIIQDQRGGGSDDGYPVEEDGLTVRYSGRTSAKMTFRFLFDNHFVPLTLKEFTGEEPYQPPQVTFAGETGSVDGILAGTIESNLALCTVKATVTDEGGNEIGTRTINLTINDTRSGQAYAFPMKRFSYRGDKLWLYASLTAGQRYRLTVSAIPASGQPVTVLESLITP